MTKTITALARRAAAAWRRRPASGCVRYAPVACPSWADVPRGCTCRWLAVAAGWVLAEANPACPAGHRGGRP